MLHPFPAPEMVSAFYADQFYTPEGRRFRGWTESLRSWYASFRGRTLNRLAPKAGRLLDFGAGAGHFAASQANRGWQVDAIDPYSSAAGSAACSLQGHGLKLHYPDQTFDAITLWYVIEHLGDPAGAIAEFHRVLKPGGILVLAQQDFHSVQARFFGPCWLFLDPPRHLWQFTVRSLDLLVGRQGFERVALDRASLEMGPFTILQSALNATLGNGNYLFRMLKHRRLQKEQRIPLPAVPTFLSVALLPLFGPAALVAYLALLAFDSSDVFTAYYRKSS
jgi:SAM-dependent methyltransferase